MGTFQQNNRKKIYKMVQFSEVVRETEKALNLTLGVVKNGERGKCSFWVPKSQVKSNSNGLFLSEWIIGEKNKEFCEKEHIEHDENVSNILLTDQTIEE